MGKPSEIDFGFDHDDRKIWDLDIPIEEISLQALERNLDIMYLEKEGTDDWNLTLRQFIQHPEQHPSHLKKIQNVQMEYPIAIYYFRGSWKILDGVHRYCRAILEGKESMSVRKVTDVLIPTIMKAMP